MTDPITCPECGGSGEEHIGTLRMACNFCHGRGKVGGDFEPAEGGHQRTDGYRQPYDGETYDRDIHGPLPGIQQHAAVKGSGLCPDCLGARTVINLGDIYKAPAQRIVELPCPRCQGTARAS